MVKNVLRIACCVLLAGLIAFTWWALALAGEAAVENPNFISDTSGWSNANCVNWQRQPTGYLDPGRLNAEGNSTTACQTLQTVPLTVTGLYTLAAYFNCSPGDDVDFILNGAMESCACTNDWVACQVTNTISSSSANVRVDTWSDVVLDNFSLMWEIISTTTPTPTPTSTPYPIVAPIDLPGGGQGVLEYKATFGEIATMVGTLAIAAILLFSLTYTIVLQVWFVNRLNASLDEISLHTKLLIAEWRKRQYGEDLS